MTNKSNTEIPSLNHNDLLSFVEMLNREHVEVCHLNNVWEDFVKEKLIDKFDKLIADNSY